MDKHQEQSPRHAAQTDPSELEQLRSRINAIDAQIVALLNERAETSLNVGAYKRREGDTAVFRPEREAALLRRLATLNTGPLPQGHLRAIYREILSSSRQLQRPQHVAFLGPEGTFSHRAALSVFGSQAVLRPQSTLADVFRAVENDSCAQGIVPLHNTLEGSIGQSIDLLLRHSELRIHAESIARIRHSLLRAQPSMEGIARVYSHPQPLGQCAEWLARHLPDATLIPMESTAAAAARACTEPDAAAIAHASLSQELGLHLLAEGIEDMPGNHTRFIVIAKGETACLGTDKSSIMFSVADTPGSLAGVLQAFAAHGMNIRKLESRPMRGDPGTYVFFADLDSGMTDSEHLEGLRDAATRCVMLRLLGCYPKVE